MGSATRRTADRRADVDPQVAALEGWCERSWSTKSAALGWGSGRAVRRSWCFRYATARSSIHVLLRTRRQMPWAERCVVRIARLSIPFCGRESSDEVPVVANGLTGSDRPPILLSSSVANVRRRSRRFLPTSARHRNCRQGCVCGRGIHPARGFLPTGRFFVRRRGR